MRYRLLVERRARRDLDDMPPGDFHRVESAIERLAHGPRPRQSQKLRGPAPLWRRRVGDYRIVYAIFDRERLVRIVRVARRSERTYEGLA